MVGGGHVRLGFPGRTQEGAQAVLWGVELCLDIASFDVLRSVIFFYIKSPMRVEEAGLQELIPTTWWPHRSGREVGGQSRECASTSWLQEGPGSPLSSLSFPRPGQRE